MSLKAGRNAHRLAVRSCRIEVRYLVLLYGILALATLCVAIAQEIPPQRGLMKRVAPLRVIKKVDAEYSDAARAAGLEGVVGVKNSLDDDRARPLPAQTSDILPARGGIKQAADMLGDARET